MQTFISALMVFSLALAGVGFSASAKADDAGANPLVGLLTAQWPAVHANILAAQTNEALLDNAQIQFQGWAAQARPFPQLAGDLAASDLALGDAVKMAGLRDYTKCEAEKDPHQIAKLGALVQWAQTNQGLTLSLGAAANDVQNFITHCAHFKLKFESVMDMPNGLGNLHTAVLAEFPLSSTVIGTEIQLNGAGHLDYTAVTWPAAGQCTFTGVGNGGPMSVITGSIKMDLTPFMESLNDLHLILDVPATTETITTHCPMNITASIPENTWSGSWRTSHVADEYNGGVELYEIIDWEFPMTETLATRTYQESPVPQIIEHTVVTLLLDPQ